MAESVETDKTKKAIRSETKDDAGDADQALLARRRLLRLGAYVPPAILGMAILSSMPSAAHAAVGSCSPTACQPCVNVSAGTGNLAQRNQCKTAQLNFGSKKGKGGS